MKLPRIIIFLLIVIPMLSNAQYCVWSSKLLSASCGPTYKFDNTIYSTYEFSYATYHSSGAYHGVGLEYTNLKNSNYSFGLTYYNSIVNLSRSKILPFLGISPEYYQIDNFTGMNIQPKIGLTMTPQIYKALYLNLMVSYGYEIPIINQSYYNVSQQNLSVRLSLMADIAYMEHKHRMKAQNKVPEKTMQ